VTGDAKGPTEKWIKEHGAKYGYAYDKGGKFARLAGISSIPSAVVVDATGKVVYSGGAGGYSEELLKQAMTGALKKPLWELPKEFGKIRAAVVKGDFAAALKEAEALEKNDNLAAEATAMKASLTSLVEGRLAAAKSAGDAGDWAGAKSAYEQLAKGAVGLPAEKAAKDALAEIAKNPDAAKAIKAQKALDAILALPDKKAKDKEAKLAALREFAMKNSGFAAKRAEGAAGALAGQKG
jgi:hypothetical protein